MDPNVNTKSGPELEQAQSPGLQESASQADEPGKEPGPAELDAMQQESPRACKLCGGPNHYGCGCEAKAAKELPGPDEQGPEEPGADQAIANEQALEQQAAEQPALTPAEEQEVVDETLEDILSPEGIRREHESFLRMATDIKTMADGFGGLCALLYDTNNYLKIIADDCISIRKLLSKEDEVKNATPKNNKD